MTASIRISRCSTAKAGGRPRGWDAAPVTKVPGYHAKGAKAHFRFGPKRPAKLPTYDGFVEVYDDYSKKSYRFPNVNGDKTVICREVATERDLLYVGGVFYEVPADNAGGFAELRPIALSGGPVKSIEAKLGLVYVDGKPMALDSLWKNGTAAAAYWLWEGIRN